VINSDGNCLFHASQRNHEKLRTEICDFMLENKEEYQDLFEPLLNIKEFSEYIEYKKENAIWGDHIEIVTASKLKRFNFTIYASESLIVSNIHINDPTYKMLYLEFYQGIITTSLNQR